MDIKLKVVDTADVQVMLEAMGKGPARQAVQRWSNWLGLEAQGEMRGQIPTRFSMRGTADGFRQAIVFSSAQMRGEREMKAELKVGGPGFGQSRTQKLGVILARHEEAATRTESGQVFYDGKGRAMTGLGFFLPAKGLRTAANNPPKRMYPAAIGAALRMTPDSRLVLAKGTKKGSKAKGTGESFFATREGIFRRKHTSFGGRTDVDAVWWFRGRIRTPARLGLWMTAEKVFQRRAIALGVQAIEETLFRQTL